MDPELIGAVADKGCFMRRVAHVEPKDFAKGTSGAGLQFFIMKLLEKIDRCRAE